MRKFKLINSDGSEFDLMRRDAFFSDPSGLGMDRSFEQIAAGYDFIETDSELEQKTISGEMVFAGYAQYTEFIAFCAKSPLTFCYMPANEWFYVSCKIEKIEKGEIDQSRVLLCGIDFLCFSTWYSSETVAKTADDPNIGKIYSYAYPFTYTDTTAGSILINNDGGIDSPCRIHIMGACKNPSWSLIVGGKIVASGKLTIEIADGNKIVIDSSPASAEIAEYTTKNVYVKNLYQYSDFSTARFILIPPGASKLAIQHDGAGELNAFVEVKRIATTV